MEIHSIQTTVFKTGENLFSFVTKHIPPISQGEIVVITSKIVALSEKRVASAAKKYQSIARESTETIATPWAVLTKTNEGWGINAGIDESNVDGGSVILMPKNAHATATNIRARLMKQFKRTKLGVLIVDTRSTPLRKGTVGRAVGYAGFKPLKSYIGKQDLFGRESRVTVSNHADALAGAAVCTMGEGSECTPLAIIRKAPVAFTNKPLSEKEKNLSLLPTEDIFSFIYTSGRSGTQSPDTGKPH